MKTLILSVIALSLIQTASAAVMAKCSLTKRNLNVSGINLLLSNDEQYSASAYVFFKNPSKERLEGSYEVTEKMEMWYFGSDISRPAGEKPVRLVTANTSNDVLSMKTELRFIPKESNSRGSGTISLKENGKKLLANESIICDITNTLQE